MSTIYQKAVDAFGKDAQIMMMFEEMAELQFAICKMERSNKPSNTIKMNVAEEIADVGLMLEQMKVVYNLHDLVDFYKKKKIERLKSRIMVHNSDI